MSGGGVWFTPCVTRGLSCRTANPGALRVSCSASLEILLLAHQCDLSYPRTVICEQRLEVEGLRGCVTVVGRQKEMRIHGSDSVFCRQVEDAICRGGHVSDRGGLMHQTIQTTICSSKIQVKILSAKEELARTCN